VEKKPTASKFPPSPYTPFWTDLLLLATSWTNLLENQSIQGLSTAGSNAYQTPSTPSRARSATSP